MRYLVDDMQKRVNITNIQKSDKETIEKLYQRLGDNLIDRTRFFVRLICEVHRVTQPSLEELLENNGDWKDLNRKLDTIRNRVANRLFNNACLSYINFIKGMAAHSIYFRYNKDYTGSISSDVFLGELETSIYKLLSKYKKVNIDDIQTSTTDKVVESKINPFWHNILIELQNYKFEDERIIGIGLGLISNYPAKFKKIVLAIGGGKIPLFMPDITRWNKVTSIHFSAIFEIPEELAKRQKQCHILVTTTKGTWKSREFTVSFEGSKRLIGKLFRLD